MFCLSACSQSPNIQFKVEDGYIQYYDGEAWYNLIAVSELEGDDADVWTIGDDGYWYQNGNRTENKATGSVGQKGNGIKSITLSTDPSKTNESQTTYIITLDDKSSYEFVVKHGSDGKDCTYSTYTVTYDYGKSSSYFKTQQTFDTVKSTEWIQTLPEIKTEYAEAFLGWFIKDTAKQIENYDFIGGNVTLEARFDFEKLGVAGLFQNGKFVMAWADIKEAYPNAIVDGEIKNNSQRSFFDKLSGDLVIDDEVTILGDYCFAYCDKLSSITIPTGVLSIGDYAFNSCDKLNGIIIPATVSSIGDCSFWSCGLTSIKIPKSVTSIGSNAFRGCGKLESIIVEEGNAVYDSRDNCNGIIKTSTNTLVVGCKETIIPKNVTSIGSYAFMDNYGLESIAIPTGATSIGASAFRGCTKLISIIIPESVTSIKDYAFGDYCGLKNVYYLGTSVSWSNIETISSGNEALLQSTIHYFIENQEDLPNDDGNYWHYDTDGTTPIAW